MPLRDVKMLMSLSCEEASRLASDSLDRELAPSEHWALRLHTFICGNCRRMAQHFQSLRELLSKMPASSQQELRQQLPQLSAARKQRIKQLLRDARQAELG